MRKIKFFTLLLGLVAIFGLTRMIKAEQQPVTVTVKYALDGVIDDEKTFTDSETYLIGGIITLENISFGSNEFMFWTFNGSVRSDLPENNVSFRVTSKMELVAHYASAGKKVGVFLDSNLRLLKEEYLTTGSFTPPTDVPEKSLAERDGWSLIGSYGTKVETFTLTDDTLDKTFYVANYQVKAVAGVAVIINGESSTKAIGSLVTATTSNPNFSYWRDVNTGAIISYQSSFDLTVVGAIEIESVHNEGTFEGPMVSIRRYFDLVGGKDTFVGQFELPEGYELIEFGFMHDNKTDKFYSSSRNETTNEFMVSVSNQLADGFTDNDYNMRAFLTYKDGEGNVFTIRNKSSYEVTLETTVQRVETKDTIYAVGNFNEWSFLEGDIQLDKAAGKYTAVAPISLIVEPGFTLEYKYVSATEHYDPNINWEHGAWEFGEKRDTNREIILKNIRNVMSVNDQVTDFENHPDDPFEDDKMRVYVKDENNYDIKTFHLYIFDGGGYDTSWPGYAFTKKSLNGYYYMDINMPDPEDATFSIVINWNNATEQTNDITGITLGKTFISVFGRGDGHEDSINKANLVPYWDPNYVPTPETP